METLSIYHLGAELEELEQKFQQWADEHEGDMTEFKLLDELEAVQMDFEKKVLNTACWIINLRASAQAMKDQANEIVKRADALNKKADSIEAYLEKNVPHDHKFEDSRVKVSWKTSKKVVVECDITDLPEKFIRFPDPEPKKDELKKAIAAGEKFDGVSIETNYNLQIK